MRDKSAMDSRLALTAFSNVQAAMTGLRGRDLLSTLRGVAGHGLRNPLVVKERFNSGGNSIVPGITHLANDLPHNNGLPSQVTKHAREVGETVTTAKGSVVFCNELLGLIQYWPTSHPGGLEVCGTPIRLHKVTVDSFSVGGQWMDTMAGVDPGLLRRPGTNPEEAGQPGLSPYGGGTRHLGASALTITGHGCRQSRKTAGSA